MLKKQTLLIISFLFFLIGCGGLSKNEAKVMISGKLNSSPKTYLEIKNAQVSSKAIAYLLSNNLVEKGRGPRYTITESGKKILGYKGLCYEKSNVWSNHWESTHLSIYTRFIVKSIERIIKKENKIKVEAIVEKVLINETNPLINILKEDPYCKNELFAPKKMVFHFRKTDDGWRL